MGKNMTYKYDLCCPEIELNDDNTLSVYAPPCGTISIATGTVVDRLHEFESIGMEPDEIKNIIERADVKEIIERTSAKKVRVDRKYSQYYTMIPREWCGATQYACVKEVREYRCPKCGTLFEKRQKVTKLYPNRTIGIEGDYVNDVTYREKCGYCKQVLDWDDVKKETWN